MAAFWSAATERKERRTMTEALPRLFAPATLAGVTLRNRIAMAPLTRQMAEADGTPTAEMVAYYARRARGGAGLIITEGTYPDDGPGCRAYLSQPGIATARHVAAWRPVAEAIHAGGAKAILQLMHGGRVTDPRCLPPGAAPVSASDTQSGGWVLYTDTDAEAKLRGITGPWPKVTFGPARALTVAEIEAIADGFAAGAARAVEAGFDGVEVHGANGYLLYQFIHDATNHRTDAYGGSVENRVRFARLVCERVRQAIGPERIITLRLSQDGVDDFTGAWAGGVATARAIGAALSDCAADALHWSSFAWRDNRDPTSDTPMPAALRAASGKPMIANGGIDQGAEAEAALADGAADLVAVGRPMFANPDWPQMVRAGVPVDLVPFDRSYVIRPPLDHAHADPRATVPPDWPTVW
ncbi:NADH:flavin oxidoreductase [Acidisphaera rubrifaciens HS-AP3]|uniref:NADH:flavin oxidoreductase n=2 Tax=Acidisphaera TaxID=50714 RepID=A0A0D6PB21_9PROT|nr:NADH:flavin oxidoreductase [Acidisphaera rubrifaciens HS-AP3]